MPVAATTKIESINIMMAAIGESPVNTLTGVLPVDAQLAMDTLHEQSKMVQSEGWSFNTEIDVTLTRDNFKKIALSLDILRVDANIHQHPSVDPIQRGVQMYDRLNNTFDFEEDLICTVIYFRAFEEIPEPARNYITIKAARVFIDRLVGDAGLRGYTSQDEARARSILLETDLANADHNILRGDPSLSNVFSTYSPANALIR